MIVKVVATTHLHAIVVGINDGVIRPRHEVRIGERDLWMVGHLPLVRREILPQCVCVCVCTTHFKTLRLPLPIFWQCLFPAVHQTDIHTQLSINRIHTNMLQGNSLGMLVHQI